MVKFASLLSVALLPLALLSASPLEERNNCIADGEAKELLHKWISFFVKLDSKLAKETLTPGFAEYSASTNFFLGKDTTAVTFESRDAFIKGQLEGQKTQAQQEKFTVLSYTHTCNQIWFRWVDNSKPATLNGFDEFYVKKTYGSSKWQIYKAYSEFNSAAVLYNAGLFPCPAGPVSPAPAAASTT